MISDNGTAVGLVAAKETEGTLEDKEPDTEPVTEPLDAPEDAPLAPVEALVVAPVEVVADTEVVPEACRACIRCRLR